MNREIKFRAYVTNLGAPFMAIQGEPDLETLGSFFHHYCGSEQEKLMQFTGLKDIEGKEIYEGDIILGYNNPHVVTFADGAFYLTYKNSSVRLSRTCGALKIIGNIYENPELCPI